MKNIFLSTALLSISFAAVAADPPLDCTVYNQKLYSHCTHFVDSLPDPFVEGYMMRVSYTLAGKTPHTADICLNSNSQLTFDMENKPGKYTTRFDIAHKGANGELSYKPFASQTFQHTGKGQANPNIFKMVIDPSIPVTCDRSTSINRSHQSIPGVEVSTARQPHKHRSTQLN